MRGLVNIRRMASALALTLSLAGATIAISASPAHASWYPAKTGGSGVTIRDCFHSVVQQPSTSCTYVTFVPANTPVRIVCQHSGQSIGGDPVWDYIVWESGPGRPDASRTPPTRRVGQVGHGHHRDRLPHRTTTAA